MWDEMFSEGVHMGEGGVGGGGGNNIHKKLVVDVEGLGKSPS